MSRLTGKSVVVTGGANGIGRHYCEQLVQVGANVLIADVDVDNGKQLAETLNQGSGERRVVAVRVDVTSEHDTQGMADAALENFGTIDVLINNAGTYPHRSFEEITYDEWRRVVTINLDSVFLCCATDEASILGEDH
jgi:NAD(P)-dependent dehydrogenase (short-subunit alcohol dehydrogenase family)